MWSIDEIIHIRIKVKSDHHIKFSNLSNWKQAWKNQGFNEIQPVTSVNTGAMLYQMSYEATYWERGQFIEFMYLPWRVKWCEVYMNYFKNSYIKFFLNIPKFSKQLKIFLISQQLLNTYLKKFMYPDICVKALS